jgi:ribonuclease BN (tRNA processing enzyme)
MLTSHEFDKPGVILENDDVKVSQLKCDTRRSNRLTHIDSTHVIDRIVHLGDTTYSPELAQFAKGADVLVHEVMYLPAIDALVKRLPDAKTSSEHLLAATRCRRCRKDCGTSRSKDFGAFSLRSG